MMLVTQALQRRSSSDHREVALIAAVQRKIAAPQMVAAAHGLSRFGEHAMGWRWVRWVRWSTGDGAGIG
jgi:hypothetical protein